MHQRFPLLAAGLLGGTGVIFGAVGTHLLGDHLAALGTHDTWETGVHFQLFHALALLGLAGWMKPVPTGAAAHRCTQAIRCWVIGTILFSGSLYVLALGGPHWVGPITPAGGLFLIAGWAYLVGTALAPRSEYDI
jgi:uncharacterized membrane protein YgdD (TMEM256/DUF423 family)